MALREIRTFDDEFLHKVSKHVDKVDDHVREILNDMAEKCIVHKLAVD